MPHRSLATAFVLGLLVAGACGGDDEAAPRTTTTEASATTVAEDTSTTGAPTTTSTTTTTATERTTCNDAGGSSPAVFDEAQGTYATVISDYDGSTAAMSFDVVQWLVGDDAVEAYHLENPDDPDGPPNDYFVVNASARIRTAPVRDDADVWLVRLAETSSADLKPGSVAELAGYLGGDLPSGLYWLTFAGGSITGVCEQYVP